MTVPIGGPIANMMAAKAVAFTEALAPSFQDYAQAIVDNAKALADGLMRRGASLVTGGTDNHLMLVDVTPMGVSAATRFNVMGPPWVRVDNVSLSATANGFFIDTTANASELAIRHISLDGAAGAKPDHQPAVLLSRVKPGNRRDEN